MILFPFEDFVMNQHMERGKIIVTNYFIRVCTLETNVCKYLR